MKTLVKFVKNEAVGILFISIMIPLILTLLFGCKTTDGFLLGGGSGGDGNGPNPFSRGPTMFAAIGALSIAAGIALLTITKATKGLIPLLLGIILCLLGWWLDGISEYLGWVLIPLALGLGIFHLFYIKTGYRMWKNNGATWMGGIFSRVPQKQNIKQE